MVNYLYDKRSNNWLQFLSKLPNNSEQWSRLKGNIATLKRQAETVQIIIQAHKKRPGLIIADDVGLGKTWIGILAAIAWASNGSKVLIVTPNQTLKNKWEKELRAWLRDPNQNPNPALQTRLESGKFQRNYPGQQVFVRNNTKRMIEITTSNNFNKHGFASNNPDIINTDKKFVKTMPLLLILDEAHRGQSNGRTIGQIGTRAPDAFRLLLTATPFGKNIQTLQALLKAAGCTNGDDQGLIKAVGDANGMLLNPATMDLKAFEDTIRQLRLWMIRHTIDTLPLSERRSLGEPRHVLGSLIAPSAADDDNRREIINCPIAINNLNIKQLMLHAERLRQLCPSELGGAETLVAPYSMQGLQKIVSSLNLKNNSASNYHAQEIIRLGNALQNTRGPMEQALFDFAVTCFTECEKFIVFCYHHEVADTVYKVLQEAAKEVCQSSSVKILICSNSGQSPPESKASAYEGEILVEEDEDVDKSEADELQATGGRELRYCSCYEKTLEMSEIEEARDELCGELDGKIPGFSVVESLKNNNAEGLRLLFNSPFFPMALVATTKDSEGIDLHRYCRIVVHYELGYRPETLLQANGRVRRIGSWAGRTGKPILYYYPYLEGTRSEALTAEVLRRVERFGHFMGGVPEMSLDALAQDAVNHEKNIPEPELPDLDFSNGGFCKALHLP